MYPGLGPGLPATGAAGAALIAPISWTLTFALLIVVAVLVFLLIRRGRAARKEF